MTLPTGTIDVGHDGPLPTSITTTGPMPGTIGFGYDSDLRLAALTIDAEAPIAYGYDADGLLTSAGDLGLTRNAATGFLETTTLGTTADSRTYTPYGELDTWTGTIGGSSTYAFDLDRDDAGRITTRTETLGGTTHVLTYTYDPDRGWLTEVRQDGNLVESYGYDGNGNRTSWSDFWGSGTATYDDQDRLLTAGATTYTYTPNGELLTKTQGSDVTTYTYDVRGALLGVTLPTGVQIDYLVDASGRRIGKKVDGTLVEAYLYAGGISPVAETNGAGNVTALFVYATKGNVPDYIVTAGATYRVFTDHLGSVRMVVDVQSGAVLQQIDYDAFGRITFDSNPGAQPFGFAGGLYDPQTGLTRFGARDYDPEVGRWTAKDPVGFAGGSAGLFEYCGNDPIDSVDRGGRQPEAPEREFQPNLPVEPLDNLRLAQTIGEVANAFLDVASEFLDALNGRPNEPVCLPDPNGKGEVCFEKTFAMMPITPGSFSVLDWEGYPAGIPRPAGPFRILQGEEYDAARAAANRANASLHAADASLAGKHLHEIQPVKFGGSPTDPGNKIALDPKEHWMVTVWWNKLLRTLAP